MGCSKSAQVREVAKANGWPGSVPLPDDRELAKAFGIAKKTNLTRQSLNLAHEEKIRTWVSQGIWVTPSTGPW